MNMSVAKTDVVTSLPSAPPTPAAAKVLPLTRKRPALRTRALAVLRQVAAGVLPPFIVVALLLVVWELVCRKTGATLPPPSKVWRDGWELIAHPFYDNGGLDKGLFWHLSASLQRVALGYAFASIVGVALGTLVGQSVWAMRGLDPIFQVLPHRAAAGLAAAVAGGVPRRPAVGDLRHLHHRDLADHHQHRVGIRNIPQDYRNVAAVLRLNPFEFFVKIMVPSAAPYIFTGLRIALACPGSPSSPRKC